MAGIITKSGVIGTLTTSFVTYYAPLGKTALMLNCRMTNKDTVARTVEALLYNAASPAGSVYVWKGNTSVTPIQPGESRDESLTGIPTGWTLQLKASANSAIDVFVSWAEEEN
jgi:hypothetical protein